MTQLPASIEQYLQEAGFSPTELLTMKRLLKGEPMTLRELAAKTGKSTGVLDQATKKLMERRIVTKETVNGTQKCVIASLEAIQRWVELDMIERHTALKRKKENFDAFLATVQYQKNHPEIEFFEGEAGIRKAFEKLLQIDATEWLHFAPMITEEANEPLMQLRAEMFRERRKRSIAMRVLTPDVPAGHEYQARDVYEYRTTKLVQSDHFPVSFEQYIVGDTVACIDVLEHKASFIHFPGFAQGQQKMFEVLWQQSAQQIGQPETCPTDTVRTTLWKTVVSILGLATFASVLLVYGLHQVLA